MNKPFSSDGTSVVGRIDRIVFGKDVDKWIAQIHDFRFYCGGPMTLFWEANKEMHAYISQYSEKPWRAHHRWLGVTIGGLPFWPAPGIRWNYGWEYGQRPGNPETEGDYIIETEFPKLIAMLKESGAPKHVIKELKPLLAVVR